MKLPITFPSLEITSLQDVGQLRVLLNGIRDFFGRVANAVNNPEFGGTGSRPTAQRTVGQFYFDTTLGLPVWWNGTVWVDATGTPV